MIVMDDWVTIQRNLQQAQREYDKAAGAEAEFLRTLKKNFGFKSVEEAEQAYAALIKKEHAMLAKWNAALAAFKKKYKDLIG
jgi:hypothetical protein